MTSSLPSRATRGSSRSSSTIAGRGSQVGDGLEERNHGERLVGQVERAQHVGCSTRPGDDDGVERLWAVALTGVRDRCERLSHPSARAAEIVGVDADVELREVKAEELDATAKRGEPPVCHTRPPPLSQAAVDHVEVGGKLGGRLVAGLDGPLDRVAESPPHEAELAAIRLVEIPAPELLGVRGQGPLVALDRGGELPGNANDVARDPRGLRKRSHFRRIGLEHERAGSFQRVDDRVRPDRRVAVEIATDPAAEAERSRRARQQASVVGEQELGHAHQALLEEPERMPNLVDDARTAGPHLVRLPQQGHLLGEGRLDPPPPGRGDRRVVEPGRGDG